MANHRSVLKRQPAQQNAQGNGNAAVDYVEVAQVAYGLYEERGREDGHAVDDWLKAESLVKQQQQPASQVSA